MIVFLDRSSAARFWHFSSPARLVMPRPTPWIVDRFTRSASVNGLSLSRFSMTNFRTAASRFGSAKLATGDGAGGEVSAHHRGVGQTRTAMRIPTRLPASFFIISDAARFEGIDGPAKQFLQTFFAFLL